MEQKREFFNFAVVFLELIWMMRNKVLHSGSLPQWLDFTQLVIRKANDYWAVMKWRKIGSKFDQEVHWTPPLQNWSKINVDATHEENGDAYSFCILRDAKRNMLGAWTRIENISDAYGVEASVVYIFHDGRG